MRPRTGPGFLIALSALLLPLLSALAEAAPLTIVATKDAPPFAFKQGDGSWTGISIDLWERIAEQIDLAPTEYRELGLDPMLEAVERGDVTIAIAALSVTAEREQQVDFSHPYYFSGLGVAVSSARGGGRLDAVMDRVFSLRALGVLAGVVSVLFLFGLVFWALEKRRSAMFKTLDTRGGIGMGFWWSVIMLLGNKGVVPSSSLSRLLAVGLMVTSLLMMGTFVGAIASWLTVTELERQIHQPEDLRRLRVVTVQDTTSEAYLKGMRIVYHTAPNIEAAAEEVLVDRADALVYDAPVLRYLVNKDYQDDLRVLSLRFQPQEYAIALPRGSNLREPINQALLRLRRERWWENLQFGYLGR